MAKRFTVAACALFVMLGFLAGGVSRLWEHETEITKTTETSAPIEETKPLPAEEKYILKIEDGIVVVFNESDMSRPVIVTDIYAGTLRHLDHKRLTDGIVATGDFELLSLLEDFSS